MKVPETTTTQTVVEKQEENKNKDEEKSIEPLPKEVESFKKPTSTVLQFSSANDECILMSDEDEDKTEQIEKSNSTESTLIKKNESEFVIESTILDNSIDVVVSSSKNEPKTESAETVQVNREETKAESTVPRRGRPSKLNTSTASIEDTKEEPNEPATDERPRRSTRVSIVPPPVPPAKKEATVKRTTSSLNSRRKPQIEVVEQKEEEKPLNETTNEISKEISKIEESKQVEDVFKDQVEENKEENKVENEPIPTATAVENEAPKTGASLARRSSLRIRSQPVAQKPVVEKKEPATTSRYQRKTTTTTKAEEPESTTAQPEEPEAEEKNVKSQLRRRASLNAKKEEEKPVIARGRRRTIAISSNKKEEIKEEEENKQEVIEEQDEEREEEEKVETKRKPRKSITRKTQETVGETKASKKKQVDTYSYEESDGEKEEEEAKQTSRKKRKSEDVHNKQKPVLETVAEQQGSAKQTKRKRNSTKLNNSELNESVSNANKLNTSNSTVSTPKLFFQSKQRQTPQSASTSKPLKHSTNGESPRTLASNTSLSASPNKKFKLLQGQMSSSEEETSESEEHESKTVAHKKLKAQHVKTVDDNKAKPSESEVKSEEKSEKKAAAKKSLSPPKQPAKAKIVKRASINQPTRNSSRNAKGSNMTPKIMATGIILSDKDKQVKLFTKYMYLIICI
jgi:hypothetical protein